MLSKLLSFFQSLQIFYYCYNSTKRLHDFKLYLKIIKN